MSESAGAVIGGTWRTGEAQPRRPRAERARRGARVAPVADPRSGERGFRRAGRAAFLVRRIRSGDARSSSAMPRAARSPTAPPSTRTISASRRCARRLPSYVGDLHGATRPAEIAVTSAGVNALMLASQLVAGAGDRVVAVTPLWPNLVEIPKILGASVETVSLTYGDRWLDARSRSPAGRAHARHADADDQFAEQPDRLGHDPRAAAAVLDRCRRHGIWLVADEVYERLYYGDDAKRRAVVPRSRDARRTRDRGEFVLEGVADDGLAPRLARRTDRADGRSRQARRVQHVVCAVVRPAGGRRGSAGGRAASRNRSSPICTRAAIIWSTRCKPFPASTCARRWARCTCSSRCRARSAAWSCARRSCAKRARARARQRVRSGRRRIRALVLRMRPARLDAGVGRLRAFLAARAGSSR